MTPSCLVIMYHYVRAFDRLAQPDLQTRGVRGLTPAEFAQQVDALTQDYEPIDWPTLYAATCGRLTLPAKSFLLTFDDGLAEHAEIVLPILQARGLRGLFFVPGIVLARQAMLPAHALHLLLDALPLPELQTQVEREIASSRQAEFLDPCGGEIDDQQAYAIYAYESDPALARLKYLLNFKLPLKQRDALIHALFERNVGSSAKWARQWYLAWNALTQMQSLGHSIGGHGYSHEPYSRLSPQQCIEDARKAVAILNQGLDPKPRPFSYPFGQTSDHARDAVKRAGFVHAFTTRSETASASAHPFDLPRVDTMHVRIARPEPTPCPS